MSMPTISDINPIISINRDDAVNTIITSIAMEELAIAHIINAEGEKLQYFLGTLEGSKPDEVTICDIMAANNSIQKTLKDIIKAEMLLQLKLESAVELADSESGCQTTIIGQKTWRDGNNVADTRPSSVTITLLRDGEVYKTVTVDAQGNGLYSFPCLPIWKNASEKYVYQIDETDPPQGYTKTVNGFNIVNTVEPGSINISGSKIWDDNNNENQSRPDFVTIELYQNDEVLDTIQLPKPDDSVSTVPFDFPNLPQFDAEGTPYAYRVDEVGVTGYTKDVVGYDITNTEI